MKINDVLKLNNDQFEKQLDSFDNIPKSRILSKVEEHDLRKTLLQYEHTLNKCKDGKIISAELQPIVSEFEKANYNLDNLNPVMKHSLQTTYEELKYCVESDPKTFKNTNAKLFCELYEMFKLNKAAEAMDKMKKSKFFKSNKLSKESFSIESLENFIADNNGVRSTEGFLDNFFTKLIHVSQVPAASESVQAGMLLVSILLLIVTIAVVTLCVIDAHYKSELAKILDKLVDDDIKLKGALKSRQDNVKAAALNMDQNIPAFTKQTLFKGAKFSLRQIKNFSKMDYSDLDKSAEEFNQECNDIIAQSEEGVYETLVENLYKPFIAFVTKCKGGIIAVSIIIALITVGIPLLRAIIYHFKSWRIRMSDFFSEQGELTSSNIEYLIEQRDKPTTSEMEKERLNKIITKQRVWVKNLVAWSNFFYKSEVDASSDAMYEINQDEKIDFDKAAYEKEKEEQASIDEMEGISTTDPTIDEVDDTPTSNKPIVLF